MGLPAEAYLQEAFAVKVYDGDTIEVILPDGSKKKVRYLGIDTPELHHPQRGEEELGKIAAAFNAQLVMKKAIILEVDVQPYDRYGRLLAWVWLSPKKQGPFGERNHNQKRACYAFYPKPQRQIYRSHNKSFPIGLQGKKRVLGQSLPKGFHLRTGLERTSLIGREIYNPEAHHTEDRTVVQQGIPRGYGRKDESSDIQR